MAINDVFMLPKRVRTMEQMADLLDTEQRELTQTSRTIAEMEDQLVVSTSTFLMSRHEKIFAIPINAEDTLEARRARVLAKIRGQGTVSATMLQAVASSFASGEVKIMEHPREYIFDVKFVGTLGTPSNMSDLSAALDEIKPAHLLYRYLYRYLIIREIHEVMTLAVLEMQTLDKFAF